MFKTTSTPDIIRPFILIRFHKRLLSIVRTCCAQRLSFYFCRCTSLSHLETKRYQMHTLTLFGCITLILVVPTQELSLSKATITEMYNQAFLRRFPSAPRLIKALFPNYKGKYIFNLVPLVSFRFVLCTVPS